MQVVSAGEVRAAINVTPLVDVVLVLLIIFMIVAPQMLAVPGVRLPTTDRPPQKPDDGRQIVVAIERGGRIWIDSERVGAELFQRSIQDIARDRADWQVVIKADARLTFGEIRRAMLAVESAGFKDVGLITERRDERGG